MPDALAAALIDAPSRRAASTAITVFERNMLFLEIPD
jgi:hypothetical protein